MAQAARCPCRANSSRHARGSIAPDSLRVNYSARDAAAATRPHKERAHCDALHLPASRSAPTHRRRRGHWRGYHSEGGPRLAARGGRALRKERECARGCAARSRALGAGSRAECHTVMQRAATVARTENRTRGGRRAQPRRRPRARPPQRRSPPLH